MFISALHNYISRPKNEFEEYVYSKVEYIFCHLLAVYQSSAENHSEWCDANRSDIAAAMLITVNSAFYKLNDTLLSAANDEVRSPSQVTSPYLTRVWGHSRSCN
jgi:hypothetical protein